jgi:hypothetical protein
MKPLRSSRAFRLGSAFFLSLSASSAIAALPQSALYRTFERSLTNTKSYSNRFADVDLSCTWTSPSGVKTTFRGFFDGDGKGGGSKSSGTVWKLRFLPGETGTWKYTWSWSDGSTGGTDSFECVGTGAGKGILRAYAKNPHWFAYNGTDPVYLKSYYESGTGSLAQTESWIFTNVYQTLVDNGYNHLQVNWLLPLCCEGAYYHDSDAPAMSRDSVRLYKQGQASSTMDLGLWKLMEDHVRWLEARNVGLHMFVGFEGGQNAGPAWDQLSSTEKDFYVKYVTARLAPYANIAGWNFSWEVDGSRLDYELGLAQLLQKYDVFNHLRTYEDETPKTNEYGRSEYTFAAVENHQIASTDKTVDRPLWKEAWTHHGAATGGYVTGKPVFMTEGNALWRRYWAIKLSTTADDVRPAAWAVATGGASFTWCGHSQNPLMVRGVEGLPFFGDENPYKVAAKAIDILTNTMTQELVFHRMTPQDGLLSSRDTQKVWCLAESGSQYLVFSQGGASFSLSLAKGSYTNNVWLDTKTGTTKTQASIEATAQKTVAFTPPDTKTDWALLVRTAAALDIRGSTRSPSGGPIGKIQRRAFYGLDGRPRGADASSLRPGVYLLEEIGTTGRNVRTWIQQ